VLRGQPTDLLINPRRPYKRCDDSRIKGLKSSKTFLKSSVLTKKSKVEG
jgi:hypothetical protein